MKRNEMKTYKDLLVKLAGIGFEDISYNYSGGEATILHVGLGNPWPRHQLSVFRTQEGSGGGIYFQDWLRVCGRLPVAIDSLESVWEAGKALATEALTPMEAA